MRCPVCKANNKFEDTQAPTCRRCRADLSLLVAAERQHAWTLDQARRALADHRFQEARRLAQQALGLKRDEETRKLVAVCYLLTGDFEKAWACHQTLTVNS
ncbi:MAG: hypothetical protein ACFCD0_03615 [Gemmataceae bacterium]